MEISSDHNRHQLQLQHTISIHNRHHCYPGNNEKKNKTKQNIWNGKKFESFFFRSAGHWSAISFYFHKFTSLVLLNRIYWPQCFSGYIFFLFFCSWIDIYIGNMNNNEFMDAENVFNASMDIGYFYFYIFFHNIQDLIESMDFYYYSWSTIYIYIFF